jgi:hypothetical protein
VDIEQDFIGYELPHSLRMLIAYIEKQAACDQELEHFGEIFWHFGPSR